jgi:hypothetical protein
MNFIGFWATWSKRFSAEIMEALGVGWQRAA